FARLVTHYVRANAWLEDGVLIRGAGALADIPGALVNGRFDFQAPIEHAWTLSRAWPRAELTIVDGTGHGFGPENPGGHTRRARPLQRYLKKPSPLLRPSLPSSSILSRRGGGAIRSSPSADESASDAWTWMSTPIRSMRAHGPIGQLAPKVSARST